MLPAAVLPHLKEKEKTITPDTSQNTLVPWNTAVLKNT